MLWIKKVIHWLLEIYYQQMFNQPICLIKSTIIAQKLENNLKKLNRSTVHSFSQMQGWQLISLRLSWVLTRNCHLKVKEDLGSETLKLRHIQCHAYNQDRRKSVFFHRRTQTKRKHSDKHSILQLRILRNKMWRQPTIQGIWIRSRTVEKETRKEWARKISAD